MAEDKISEIGFAIFFFAISGAAPCCAWAIAYFLPAFNDPARPKEPDNSVAKSDKISPNILVVKITSNCSGFLTRWAAHASTSISS